MLPTAHNHHPASRQDIHYDRFGQRTYTRYDNRIETHYTYDSLTRRLARMYNIAPNGTLLQDNRYTYDPVGNITAIDDNGLNPRRQVYEYDPADRLRLSEGHMGDLGINYRSEYDYSPAGKIMRKHTRGKRMNNYGTFPVDYTNEYLYPTAGNPFAIEKIESHGFGAYELLWDKNGNMTHSFSPRAGERRMCWTEDNRMQGYTEYSDETGDISAWYNYDGGGERNFKITSPKLRLRQNAAGLRYAAIMKYPTLYASALVTFNRGGYTKHYFEGTSRICSKIGGGFSDVEWNRTIERIPVMQDDYSRLSERQSESVHQTFEQCLGIGVAMEGVTDLYDVIKKEHERDEKEPAFYYHSDHLGSAAYLTNDDGKVTQTLNYLPYGEDWVDVRYDLDPRLGQYTFNGKEKDYESGFHYYGARYYWSELLTGWLSVDPMMDKYPSVSAYAYCEWNPVKFMDPDGEDKLIWYATTYPQRGTYESEKDYRERIAPYRDNRLLNSYAKRFSDRSDVIHVFAHGTHNEGISTGRVEYDGKSLNADQFSSQVLWKNNTYKNVDDNNPCVIMLHSCYTGQGEGSFAEKLSLGGNLVIAPSDACNITVNRDNQESVDKDGVWNVFLDGKKLTQLKGDVANTKKILNLLKERSPAEIHRYFKNLNKHEE